MKRLLAAGSGSIFQLCKAFRNGESGRFHNPEFTLLEWYRVGFDLHDLMNEIAELLTLVLAGKYKGEQRISYQALFHQYTGLDALSFDLISYSEFANAKGLTEAVTLCGENHAMWLDLLFSHVIQPELSRDILYLVYGYPACFSSLARLNAENSLITDRIEVFINGVELGNGYFELNDVGEQTQRFEQEINLRQQQNLPKVNKDERLLGALKAGLPDCAGMAIGLDRLLMLIADCDSIIDVLAFPIDRA